MHSRTLLSPVFAMLLFALAAVAAPAAFAQTYVVNATDDNLDQLLEVGPCTTTHCNLREALAAARATRVCTLSGGCNLQEIHFNLPRPLLFFFNGVAHFGSPAPIVLSTGLVPLSVDSRVLIDGTTQPGYSGVPVVTLKGPGSGDAGLRLETNGSVVRGLAIQSFSIGILIDSSNNLIASNYIGTDASGSTTVGNTDGVVVLGGGNNAIGAPTIGNVISGNGTGVFLNGGSANVQGNLIGTDPSGKAALPNKQDGVLLKAGGGSALVGGLGTGEGNTVAFNGGAGVNYTLLEVTHPGMAIRANSIFSNAGLGIDQRNLHPVLQVPPSITGSATGFTTVPFGNSFLIQPTTTLSGTIAGKPNSTVSLDFFDNDSCGEGQAYVGTRSVAIDGTGNAAYSVQFTTTFANASATATSAANDTSAFSNCRFVSSPFTTGTPELSPSNARVGVRKPLTYTFKWTVPPPATWHNLTSLQLRLRSEDGMALQLRWDAATNSLSVFNPASGRFEHGFAPGSDNVLESTFASVNLKDTTVKGAGPTAPTVTLSVSLSLKPDAAGAAYTVEVAASDDLGHTDDFGPVGTLTATP